MFHKLLSHLPKSRPFLHKSNQSTVILHKSFSSFNDQITVQPNNQTEKNKILSIYNDLPSVNMDPNATKMERDYIRTITPELPPTFNLATYANHLDIIRQLVKLNVRVCDIERDREMAKFLIKLDFENDVVPYLNFLIRIGLSRHDIGDFLSQNFAILKENIQNLEKRMAYYEKMNFTKKQILCMLIQYPGFINYSIAHVDERVTFFQRYLKIKPIYVKLMILGCPRILSISQYKIALEEKKFALIEQCGFEDNQMKQILIHNPNIFFRENFKIVNVFEYIFENITKDYELIVGFPGILCVTLRTFRERDQYLKKLGRTQYNPSKPLYVPLSAFMMEENDFLSQFCKTHEDDFLRFIKTM